MTLSGAHLGLCVQAPIQVQVCPAFNASARTAGVCSVRYGWAESSREEVACTDLPVDSKAKGIQKGGLFTTGGGAGARKQIRLPRRHVTRDPVQLLEPVWVVEVAFPEHVEEAGPRAREPVDAPELRRHSLSSTAPLTIGLNGSAFHMYIW
jgi:hypothetical protein